MSIIEFELKNSINEKLFSAQDMSIINTKLCYLIL